MLRLDYVGVAWDLWKLSGSHVARLVVRLLGHGRRNLDFPVLAPRSAALATDVQLSGQNDFGGSQKSKDQTSKESGGGCPSLYNQGSPMGFAT